MTRNPLSHTSLADDVTYQAIAKYVTITQDGAEGVLADEIIRDLGLSRATVYRKLKLPGFYNTPRPIGQPRGYGYDVKLAVSHVRNDVELPRIMGFSTNTYFDIHLGRLELRATNPKGVKPVEHFGEFINSTHALMDKVTNVTELFNEARSRNIRFASGDANAFDPSADLNMFKSFADLVSACRLISEMGQAVLKSDELTQPDYWKVFD